MVNVFGDDFRRGVFGVVRRVADDRVCELGGPRGPQHDPGMDGPQSSSHVIVITMYYRNGIGHVSWRVSFGARSISSHPLFFPIWGRTSLRLCISSLATSASVSLESRNSRFMSERGRPGAEQELCALLDHLHARLNAPNNPSNPNRDLRDLQRANTLQNKTSHILLEHVTSVANLFECLQTYNHCHTAAAKLFKAMAAMPIKREKPNQDITPAIAAMATIARAAQQPSRLGEAACDVLACFALPRPLQSGNQFLSQSAVIDIIVQANVVSAIADCAFGLVESSPSSELSSLRALRQLTSRADCAAQLARHSASDKLLIIVGRPMIDQHVHLATELLWNTVDAAPAVVARSGAAEQLSAELYRLFKRTSSSPSIPHSELSNEALAIVATLARYDCTTRGAVSHAGWYDAACLILDEEMSDKSMLGLRLNELTDERGPLHLERLQLSLQLICTLTADSAPADATTRLSAPLSLLFAPASALRWQPNALASLRRSALSICSNLVLNGCASQPASSLEPLYRTVAASAMITLHDGLRPDSREATLRILALLLSPTRISPTSHRILAAKDITQSLVSLLTATDVASLLPPNASAVSREVLEEQPLSTGEMQDLLATLTYACSNNADNQAIIGLSAGIEYLVHITIGVPQGHAHVFLLTLELLWTACSGSTANIHRLVDCDGVGGLLDIVVDAELPVQAIILSCLSEVLSNERARQAAVAWESEDGRDILALMLGLWREEEARLHGFSGPGAVKSSARPLSKPLSRPRTRSNMMSSLALPEKGDDVPDQRYTFADEEDDDDCLPIEPHFVPLAENMEDQAAPTDAAKYSNRRPSQWLTDAAAGKIDRFLCGHEAPAGSLDAAISGPSIIDAAEPSAAIMSLKSLSRLGLQMTGRLPLNVGQDNETSKALATVTDKIDNRSRVYAVLSKLEFSGGQVSRRNVSDSLLLSTIREYPALREAEAWQDVADEMTAEGIRPITADAERMTAKTEAAQAAVNVVMLAQSALLETAEDEEEAADDAQVARIKSLVERNEEKRSNLQMSKLRAKTEQSDMISRSFVAYEGPKATNEEIAQSALELALESLNKGESLGLTHMKGALMYAAEQAQLPSGAVNKFLANHSPSAVFSHDAALGLCTDLLIES